MEQGSFTGFLERFQGSITVAIRAIMGIKYRCLSKSWNKLCVLGLTVSVRGLSNKTRV